MNDLVVLRNIFREVFDDEFLSITEETSRNDLEEWDSIGHVKLVLTVESEFGIRLSTEEVATIKCVSDFLAVIKRHEGE